MLMNDDLVMCLSVRGSTLAACDNEPLVHAQSISQIDQNWGLWLGEKKKPEVQTSKTRPLFQLILGPICFARTFHGHNCGLHSTLSLFSNNFCENVNAEDLPHCQAFSFVAPLYTEQYRERYSSDSLPCIEICCACMCVNASRDSCAAL